jgi:ribose/xylose/arabinose/galactoside ABC-type transport system permease subunit
MTTVVMAWTTGKLAELGLFDLDHGIWIGMLAALLASILVGFVNGIFIVKCKIPPMIATLAMQNMLYGLIATLSNGFPVITIPSWFSFFGSGKVFNVIPVPVVIMFVVFIITYYLLAHTPFGRAAIAVGGNAESARLSGINVVKTKFLSLIIVQVCCWVSGIMLAGQVLSGNASFGSGYEMNAIASVVIGGASISGGIGNMTGTLLGILFLQILTNGMTLLNVSTYIQYVVRGALIVGAVMFSTLKNRKK